MLQEHVPADRKRLRQISSDFSVKWSSEELSADQDPVFEIDNFRIVSGDRNALSGHELSQACLGQALTKSFVVSGHCTVLYAYTDQRSGEPELNKLKAAPIPVRFVERYVRHPEVFDAVYLHSGRTWFRLGSTTRDTETTQQLKRACCVVSIIDKLSSSDLIRNGRDAKELLKDYEITFGEFEKLVSCCNLSSSLAC